MLQSGFVSGGTSFPIFLIVGINENIRWIFFAILSFLGFDMVFKGLHLINFLITFSLMIQFFISVIISIVLISLLFYNSKRKEWRKVNEKSRR